MRQARDWWRFASHVYRAMTRHSVLLVAAGITFYGLLAMFPALSALISLFGLFADPRRIAEQLQSLAGILPSGAIDVVGAQLSRISAQPGGGLGVAFALGLAVALWSANSGVKAMFEGLNIARGVEERRSFLRLNATSLLFTLAAIAAAILVLGAVVVAPAVIDLLGLGALGDALIRYGRWPLLLVVVLAGMSLLFRYGPDRRAAPIRPWVTPGSLLATLVWLAASVAFSWYVANFGRFNETYGSLGAVIGFMVWMWLSASIVLIGAEVDVVLETAAAHLGPDAAKQG